MSASENSSPGSREGRDDPSADLHPDLILRERVAGSRPGDRVVRIARHRYFWGTASGALRPRPEATEPRSPTGKLFQRIKYSLIGRPIPTAEEAQERLSLAKALAVLSPDALSSVAYASEAAMRILIVAGVGALSLTLPVSIAVALLLIIVATSYQQTIAAYPSGGGSYIVARQNLGVLPGLVAGTALIVGYVLTVAVSIAAGADAIISAFPALERHQMALIAGALVVMTLANLRGVREAGTVFIIPTYAFVLSILGLIAFGLFRLATGGIPYQPVPPGPEAGTQALTWFLVISAFAKGCSAMTGTEAIANAVPIFKQPEARNARLTLALMAGTLATMFVGVSFLVSQVGVIPDPNERETVLSQITRAVTGEGWYYYLVQFATAMILSIAANTCFAGFPWLLKIMAQDRYVPRWFGMRGDRLVLSTGMIVLAVSSLLLLVLFGGSVDRLLSLYAIGVFIAFTLSQAGMVVHWLRGQERWRLRKALVNGFGALVTATVTLVLGITRFQEGAWIVLVLIPIMVALCLGVHNHYMAVARQLSRKARVRPRGSLPLVVVPVGGLNLVSTEAVNFARDLSKRVIAVHVTTDAAEGEELRKRWQEATPDVPLVIIESPYRLLIPPLLAYLDALRERHPDDGLVVMLPEFVPKHWWENVLHNQTALRLKAALLYRPGVVVANIPIHLQE